MHEKKVDANIEEIISKFGNVDGGDPLLAANQNWNVNWVLTNTY